MDNQPGKSRLFELSLSTSCIVLVLVAWLGAAVYALADSNSLVQKLAQVPVAAGMIGFVFLHGLRRYGTRALSVFTMLVFLIAWGSEMLSIVTGFPFGSYTYTEMMRPYIGHVPAIVMPVYWVMGYVCWSMAHILLDRFDPVPDRQRMISLPILAAVLMVTWDLSMDPLRSTLEMRWIWIAGGDHYGVPASNFFGWFMVTWTMFQSFAIYLRSSRTGRGQQNRKIPDNPFATPGTDHPDRSWFWTAVPLMYLTFALEHILRPLATAKRDQIVMVNGDPESLAGFVADIAWLTAGTMVPLAGIALILVARRFSPSMKPRISLTASPGDTSGQ